MKQRVSLGAALGLSLALSAACDGSTGGASQDGAASGGATNGSGASAGGSGSASAGTNDPNGGTNTGTNAGNGGTNAGGNDSGATNGGVNGGNNGTPPACDASSAPAIGKLALERVVSVDSGFRLMWAAQPPGSSDWYLVGQYGEIRVFKGSGTPTKFMTVPGAENIGDSEDERGLLGLAFAPDYATSRKFYVMVTQTQGEPYGGHDVVFEYERSASDPYAVAAGDPKLIVDVPASAVNHNGGSVLFGPDGMLYVGTGDGGGGCNNDKPGAPQDVTSLYGKILRLNPKAAAPHAAAGNPFSDDPRVLHYGLRNPFRFGFDRLTGDLYIGDVGQDDYEEISFAPSGSTALNFGWPDFEGNAGDTCGGAADIRPGSTHTRPIFVADRSGQGGATYRDYRSIIGGFVYRGSAVAKLQGAYVFGDYVGQRLGALYQCGAQTSPVTPIRKACDLNNPSEACLAPQNGAPAVNALMGILEGSDGEMYLVANRTTLYKVVPN